MATTSDNLCDLGSSCAKQSARPPTTENRNRTSSVSYPTPDGVPTSHTTPRVVASPCRRRCARTSRRDPRSRSARAVPPPTAHPAAARWHLLGLLPRRTTTSPARAPLPSFPGVSCRPLPESILTRRHLLQSSLGAALLAAFDLAPATEPALALYNKDLDDPITDPVQALAVVFAVRASVRDVIEQIALFEDTCPAPVFPCDLSQLSTKTSTRISGPLKRCLPTLSETYGADPYAVQDILQSTSTCEAMLYANNARVKVDFKGPATFLNLVDDSIAALLTEIPEDALAAGKARFEACDLTVDPTAEGDLECRLGRAVASGARPTGGIG